MTADEIADKLGINGEHPQRIEECILHVLKQASEEGHLFLGRRALVQRAVEFTAAEEFTVEAGILRLIAPWIDRWGGERPPKLVQEVNEKGYQRYYLRKMHTAEVGIADSIARISHSVPIQICEGAQEWESVEEIERMIAWFEALPGEDDPFNAKETGGIKLTEKSRRNIS